MEVGSRHHALIFDGKRDVVQSSRWAARHIPLAALDAQYAVCMSQPRERQTEREGSFIEFCTAPSGSGAMEPRAVNMRNMWMVKTSAGAAIRGLCIETNV